jgi:hypothetical protein
MSLVKELTDIRENCIQTQYSLTAKELKEKLEKFPFETKFKLYEGCVTREVTFEIARRFQIFILLMLIIV